MLATSKMRMERRPFTACDASCELFEENNESSLRGPPSRDTVCVLLSGSLDAVVLEDADEMNAVEYALLSDAPIEVVTLLQKAMRRVMRMNQSKMISSPRSCQATTIMSRIVAMDVKGYRNRIKLSDIGSGIVFPFEVLALSPSLATPDK